MHPSHSAYIREVVVAGCLSILSFQQYTEIRILWNTSLVVDTSFDVY
jgi:hypothetical protein